MDTGERRAVIVGRPRVAHMVALPASARATSLAYRRNHRQDRILTTDPPALDTITRIASSYATPGGAAIEAIVRSSLATPAVAYPVGFRKHARDRIGIGPAAEQSGLATATT
jgi:hypothetical protein